MTTLPAPPVGAAAPDFHARNQHGEDVSLAGLRGAPAVLIFFPWAFSDICTGELSAVRDELSRFRSLGARVLAVSCDPMFALRAFADAEQLEFDLLSDHWPHGAIARAYGVFDEAVGVARRGSFVLDPAGTITWSLDQGIGEPRDIAAHLAALTPAT